MTSSWSTSAAREVGGIRSKLFLLGFKKSVEREREIDGRIEVLESFDGVTVTSTVLTVCGGKIIVFGFPLPERTSGIWNPV